MRTIGKVMAIGMTHLTHSEKGARRRRSRKESMVFGRRGRVLEVMVA